MKPFYIVIFIMCFSEVSGQQASSYEQVALDYFVSDIYPKEFGKRLLSFVSHVNETQSGSVFKACFDDYYKSYAKLTDLEKAELLSAQRMYDSVDLQSLRLHVSNQRFTTLNKNGTKPGTIVVRKADTYKKGYFFVEILIYEKDQAKQFAIEMEIATKKVTRSCSGVIWL